MTTSLQASSPHNFFTRFPWTRSGLSDLFAIAIQVDVGAPTKVRALRRVHQRRSLRSVQVAILAPIRRFDRVAGAPLGILDDSLCSGAPLRPPPVPRVIPPGAVVAMANVDMTLECAAAFWVPSGC